MVEDDHMRAKDRPHGCHFRQRNRSCYLPPILPRHNRQRTCVPRFMNMAENAWSKLLKSLSDIDDPVKLASFNVLSATYKVSENCKIRADLLLGKSIVESAGGFPQKIPLIVRIHGGYLVGGATLYAPWLSDWILELAEREGAAILMPNYRLLPESNGFDILEDMDDFWRWTRHGGASKLLSEAFPNLDIDTSRTLVIGESAGGYLAMQLTLSHPRDIHGLICCYPMLEVESDFYNTASEKTIAGVPNLDPRLLEDHLVQIRSSATVPTEAYPPDRLALSFVVVQTGRFLEFLTRGKERYEVEAYERLFPLRRLQNERDADGEARGANLPPMFIFHGEQDSAVPCGGTNLFEERLRAFRSAARLRVSLQSGDHGFDARASTETPWLKQGLHEVVNGWLRSGTSNL
ncbi:hypothetical protein ANO11243_085030 [Dothideomycetidae sp. 11243]|nr:hypothetical protein ANO11243_085030 [fungal sp. No.11243]